MTKLPSQIDNWFARRGWSLHSHQLQMLDRMEAAATLLIAPTGGGKTMAGFLPTLADLARNNGLTLILALSYGGRTEIVDAVREIAAQVREGNLDPAVMYTDETTIKKEVKKILDAYGKNTGHVFNLGHGIHPAIDPANVKTLVDFVHGYSRQIRN